jgi:hypothetical protein
MWKEVQRKRSRSFHDQNGVPLQQIGNSSVSKGRLAHQAKQPAGPDATDRHKLRSFVRESIRMIPVLQFLSALFVAVTLSQALAHALELPGKMRLDREHYLATQTIYYPGFTIGGAAEPLSILALAALLAFLPAGTTVFWFTAGALAAMALMHLIFWVVVQPVNRHWLSEVKLSGGAERFFRTGAAAAADDWMRMRNQWEHGHLARAVLTAIGFVLVLLSLLES